MPIQQNTPIVISPNLDCPLIIYIRELEQGKTIPLIIAGQYGSGTVPLNGDFERVLFLRSSYNEGGASGDIPLLLGGAPVEIHDWNILSDFRSPQNTRYIINSEFHYNVLGKNTRYFKVEVRIDSAGLKGYKNLLRKNGKKYLPALYDLIYKDESGRWERVNYHSVQFVESVEADCNFIHLTDLHVAKRNDEILDEVLKVRCRRDREEIKDSYVNPNENLRKFIIKANEMADNGELDFVVITGDLVDFAFLGWEDEVNPDENNWKTFINIIIGSGKESERGNPGIKVAVFTSTGNHDWRMHPYNPIMNNTYGLEKEELKHYQYKSFDSTEYPKDDRARLSEEITNKVFNKANLDAITDKTSVKLAKYLYLFGDVTRKWTHGALGIIGISTSWYKKSGLGIVLFLLGAVIVETGRWYLKNKTRRVVDLLIDNPLHAEARALHYYLSHINPYLDYAFQYGKHCFAVMDTGSDVFNGELMDNKTVNHIKKMSLEDNVFGGSPDSRAFDSGQAYYNWSQIVWLEKVIEANKLDNDGKTFVFLHAPPINPHDDGKFDEGKLRESNRPGETKWIPEEECNLTMGTVNHYLSQFFYLCLGHRESELVKHNMERRLKQVDMVFAGHAHRNIEFRIEKDMGNKIRIYSDMYSRIFNPNDPFEWWGKYSPVIVQTAACGVPGRLDKKPPYYRKVALNRDNMILDFQVRDSDNKI